MPHSAASPSPRPKHARGVYLMPSPSGTVRIQAIDSRGDELMQITVAAALYDDRMAERLRSLLDKHDPMRRLVLVNPHRPSR